MDATEQAEWRQADELFKQLLDLPQPEQSKRLDQSNTTPSIRQKVHALIQGAEQQGLLENERLLDAVPPDLSGRQIGDWRLDEEIGRGGMATVYRAQRQQSDYTQVAALKILSTGLVAAGDAAHFRREQALLAQLAHPNIAAMIEGGVTEDGTPFLAMELLDGMRIDAHCRQRELTQRQIVALVIQACAAVSYAHSNLILHRDIKPSNLIVTEAGVVKLVDFGIGRLLSDRRATQTRAFTPEYAAPEQLAGLATTTQTDVFGLGAVLLTCLTGERPFAEDREQPLELGGLDGDLANIVQMALRDEPLRRYPTAQSLADDLQRWLQRRPVHATPDSRLYRLGKYVQRHRLAVTTALTAAVVGVAGVSTTVWQAKRAQHAANQAVESAEHANAVQNFLLEVFDGADPWLNQTTPLTADALIDSALEKLPTQLANFPNQQASVRQALARILRNLGRYPEAMEQASEAIAVWSTQDDVEALVAAKILLASIQMDAVEFATTTDVLESAIELARQASLPAAEVEAKTLLIQLQTHLGDLPRQTELANGLIADLDKVALLPDADNLIGQIHSVVAESHEIAGRYEQALEAADLAEHHLRRAHGDQHALVAEALGYQATAAFQLARWERAEAGFRQMASVQSAVYPDGHPAALWTKYQLGRTLISAGNFTAAFEHYQQFHPECEAHLGEDDPRTVMALFNLGIANGALGDLATAEQQMGDALRLMAQQSPDNPKVAVAQFRYGALLSELGEQSTAEEQFALGQALFDRQLPADHPLVARSAVIYADHYLRYQQPRAALEHLLAARTALVAAYGDNGEFIAEHDLTHGLALIALDQFDQAMPLLRAALAELEKPGYGQKYATKKAAAQRQLVAQP